VNQVILMVPLIPQIMTHHTGGCLFIGINEQIPAVKPFESAVCFLE